MPTLHLQVCAGFANRVRVMVSGMCLAKELQIPLVIHWPSIAMECGCQLESVLDPTTLPKGVSVVSEKLIQPQEILSRNDLDTLLQTWDRRSDLNIKSYGIFYSDTTWETGLQTLRPSRSVQNVLDSRCSKVIWDTAIGIHIRRTDNQKSIEGSPLEWFLEKMRAVNGAQYIVATDDGKIREQLQTEFGDRCLFPASVVSRRSEEGMIHGVGDFFALSKCSKIWGSVASSFSEIAARYGTIELVLP